jgi:hypothetical protein
MDLVGLLGFGLAGLPEFWMVNRCLVGLLVFYFVKCGRLGIKCMPYLQYPRLFGDCWETSNLLSVEELGIKCTSYLQCTWLFGDC